MDVQQILDELGTPEVAVLTIGENVWKFRQATTYQAVRKEERAERQFVAKLLARGEDGKLAPGFLNDFRLALPEDLDEESARMIYLLHKRCIDRPGYDPEVHEVPYTLLESCRLLGAPRFLMLVERVIEASGFNASARALEEQVSKEKNALGEMTTT